MSQGRIREIGSTFLDEKAAEMEEFWQKLLERGSVEPMDGGVAMAPAAADVEEFARVTGDDNYAHVKGAAQEQSRELAEMLEGSTQYTEPEVPEGFEDAGEYRPLQQGALTPTAIAYDPRLGFDGLLTDLELSFREPVFAGTSRENADRTEILKNGEGYDVTAVNPWIGEPYTPTVVDYEVEREGDFTEENRRRVALLNALVAREPLENDRSPRDGDVFHEAEADYPSEVMDGSSVEYREDSQQATDTALGPLKIFEVDEEMESGSFSYTETYIDAEV
ncbi:MAG: hypothetical protein ABEJ98_01395 [Candidatus Nanohaloarchaea archaeon]